MKTELSREERLSLQEVYTTAGIPQNHWEFLNSIPSDIRVEIMDFVESIEMLHWMLQPASVRGYAKDKERDKYGRIIVDIIKPHILEDMDYFRQSAMHFQKYGKYTNLYPNPHPKSEYRKFWDEELRRCKQGYVRESDGEWIPGYYYFYLNYFPIMRTEKSDGINTRTERVYDFVDVWDSDYLFFHYVEQGEENSEYGSVLKTRGRGYSFKVASMLDRNFYMFKKSKGFAFASESEYLTKDGILNKAWDGMEFIDDGTEWTKLRQKKDTTAHKRASYIDQEGKERGYMSEIIEVTTKGNPEKGRGKRGKLLIHEEAGIYPGLLQTWNIARPSIEDGDDTFGYQICFGTGGTPGSKFEGLEELFYRGGGYKVKMLKNVWDKVKGEGTCGYFVPEYMNRKNCYDENGNSDVLKALTQILLGRKKIRENASKQNALTQEKAERPITPQEAVMRIEGSLFPIDELKGHLEEVMPIMKTFVAKHYIGKLQPNGQGVLDFSPSADDKVIREFPLKDNINRHGAIEIFEMPQRDGQGNIPRFRYYAGIDTYDDDSSTTNSLGSIFIADILTDRIVAEFTGRPRTANEFYEICLRLLKFYNAIANYENDKKGLFAYFSQRNCLSYLADNPQILKDMELVKATNLYGNKAHPYSEKVYTPNGIKKWEDIKVGDNLFGTYGNITKVIDIPFDAETDIYKITLQDGRSVKASLNHLWNVIDWNGYEKTLTTQEILNYYYREKEKYKEFKYYIPKHEAVEYKKKQVEIDPYLLGLFLGDGCMTQSRHHQFYFTSSLSDMENYKECIPYEIKTLDDRHHRIVIKNIGKKLTKLGLQETKSRTKFIPDIYKYNIYEVRLNILQGLLDTDGCIGYGGNPEYCTTSEVLANDVLEVARSLGINCNLNISENDFGKVYKVRFYTDVKLFKLERKASKQKIIKTRAYKTAIVNIEYIGTEKSKCVTVDSKDNCYLINEYVTTHNSKGTNSGVKINAWGRRLQADWMLEPAYGEEKTGKLNFNTIRSIGYLKEAIGWNADGNFDRVSSMGMLMILREEYKKYKLQIEETMLGKKISNLASDSFFDINYNMKGKVSKQIMSVIKEKSHNNLSEFN
jgi:hypothetical protein